MAFLACVHLALFLALSVSAGNSLVSLCLLCGEKYRLFAYSQVDVSATLSSIASLKSRMGYVSSADLPRLYWKEAVKRLYGVYFDVIDFLLV